MTGTDRCEDKQKLQSVQRLAIPVGLDDRPLHTQTQCGRSRLHVGNNYESPTRTVYIVVGRFNIKFDRNVIVQKWRKSKMLIMKGDMAAILKRLHILH